MKLSEVELAEIEADIPELSKPLGCPSILGNLRECERRLGKSLQINFRLLDALRDGSTPCPECNGSGKTNMTILHAKRTPGAEPMNDEQAKSLADYVNHCRLCDGSGRVSPERLAWRQIGKEWHAARLALGVGLREWANRVGVLPSEYCDMEHGRKAPDPKCSPVKELAALREAGEGDGAEPIDEDWSYVPFPATRADVRNLCAALGITITEPSHVQPE